MTIDLVLLSKIGPFLEAGRLLFKVWPPPPGGRDPASLLTQPPKWTNFTQWNVVPASSTSTPGWTPFGGDRTSYEGKRFWYFFWKLSTKILFFLFGKIWPPPPSYEALGPDLKRKRGLETPNHFQNFNILRFSSRHAFWESKMHVHVFCLFLCFLSFFFSWLLIPHGKFPCWDARILVRHQNEGEKRGPVYYFPSYCSHGRPSMNLVRHSDML